jgi:hypothetical protein
MSKTNDPKSGVPASPAEAKADDAANRALKQRALEYAADLAEQSEEQMRVQQRYDEKLIEVNQSARARRRAAEEA